MTLPIDRAIAGAATANARAAGRTITLRRGSSETVVTGVLEGQTRREVDDGQGLLEIVATRDFILDADDYAFACTASTPQRGDEIDRVIDGSTVTFAVMPPGPGADCYRYCDAAQTRLRVHTKRDA